MYIYRRSHSSVFFFHIGTYLFQKIETMFKMENNFCFKLYLIISIMDPYGTIPINNHNLRLLTCTIQNIGYE